MCMYIYTQDANTTTIRTAYRKLSLHWHPDKVRQSVVVVGAGEEIDGGWVVGWWLVDLTAPTPHSLTPPLRTPTIDRTRRPRPR